jgi:hypothetical protein
VAVEAATRPQVGRLARPLLWALALALPPLIALRLAVTPPAVVGIDAVDEALRVWIPAIALFGVAGFGVVRLLLPESLRRHELLWVLPVGAATVAIAMTPLGFANVPFTPNLILVIAGALALDVHAVRRRGWPPRPGVRADLWPLYVATLIMAVALIPMFRSGFATVVGMGQDAHMAAGSAELLRHTGPTGTDIGQPIDTFWPTWRSKQAIYYAFAAVTALTGGLETYETLSALASLLFALACLGFFVFARELLGSTVGAAVAAMALAGLSRMALHTVMHPYFNQTWGLMAFPFCIVAGWAFVRAPGWGTGGFLALLLAIEGLAYPVALPIAGLAIAVFWWVERRRRRAAGEPYFAFTWRSWVRGLRAQPRRIRWPAYVAVFFLLVPAWGVFEKIYGAFHVAFNANQSLELWGGDVSGYFPERQFFGIVDVQAWWLLLLGIVAAAVWQLRRAPRPVAWGLLALFAAAALLAGEMRLREFGWYFHFKILAFVAPLVIVAAVVALRGAGRWGIVALCVWGFWVVAEAREELRSTFDELPRTMLDLREWSTLVPAEASIRLDVQPDKQPWPAYLLHAHPLCSQRPLHNTAYPHVQVSRAADYVLARGGKRPFDAQGRAIAFNEEFALFELRDDLPGGDRCSRAMVQTVTGVSLGNGL